MKNYNSLKLAGALAATSLLSGCNWFSTEEKPVEPVSGTRVVDYCESNGTTQRYFVEVSAVTKPALSFLWGHNPITDGTKAVIYSNNGRGKQREAVIYDESDGKFDGNQWNDALQVTVNGKTLAYRGHNFVNAQGQEIRMDKAPSAGNASAIGNQLSLEARANWAKYGDIAARAISDSSARVNAHFEDGPKYSNTR